MLDFIKSIPSKLKHNVGMKLLSLVLAFVVWLLVVMYYNPETTDRFTDIPITINYDKTVLLEEHGLILITEPEGTVSVEIEDRREELKAINGNITAAVDISSVTRAGEYALPVRILVSGQTVTTVNQSVDTVTLKFEKATRTQFTVSVVTKGEVPEGYVLEKVANPTVVTVTGPDSIVSRIVTVQAMVSQDKFSESGVYDGTILYLDKDGKELESTHLSLDTDAVKVNVSVSEEKEVPLLLEITNASGGNDSAYANLKIEPSTIVITGNPEKLAEINSISLGLLDVSEIKENYSAEISLILPNGIKNVDSVEKADVTLDLTGTATKQFVLSASALKVENVPEGTNVTTPTGKITVTVRGDAADVAKLKASDISLYMDCKNQELTKGANKLPVYFAFPENYKVGTVGKYELTIKVS